MWTDTLEQFCSGFDQTCKTFKLTPESEHWKHIEKQFAKDPLSGNLKLEDLRIKSIEMVQNIVHWARFNLELVNLEKKLGRQPTVYSLWHGTRSHDPRYIIRNEAGLNINFARGGHQWGKGLHFAADAAYSCPTFSYWVPNKPHTY